MRFYIVDDNIAVIKVLENIIRTRELGQTIGTSTDPEQAVREIIHLQPEIVLVDLLMSGIDGVTLVTEVKKQAPEIAFVMISKVSDKKMVQSAYEAGVEFFIQKPISVIHCPGCLFFRPCLSMVKPPFVPVPLWQIRADPRSDGLPDSPSYRPRHQRAEPLPS